MPERRRIRAAGGSAEVEQTAGQLRTMRGAEIKARKRRQQTVENNVAEKVIDIITREQHLQPGVVKLDSTFAELGIDSLDAVNILFALESEFKIDIPDAVAQNMKNVRQAVDSLTRVLEGKDVSDLVALAKGGAHAAGG